MFEFAPVSVTRGHCYQLFVSDVNKDWTPKAKAKAKAKDQTPKAKAKDWAIKAKDLAIKAKDLRFVLKDRPKAKD